MCCHGTCRQCENHGCYGASFAGRLRTLAGCRDRALLALGFAAAFRCSELCALEVADLTEVPDGLRILGRRSKGDQEGQGQEVAISRGYRLRPVEAVQTWLAAAKISSGPVFRAVARGGRVSCEGLADDSAARIVKRYARRVGLDPASYAGHSLRSGFLTSAAEAGASIWKLSERAGTARSTHCAATCAVLTCSRNTRERRS
jgi:integrase